MLLNLSHNTLLVELVLFTAPVSANPGVSRVRTFAKGHASCFFFLGNPIVTCKELVYVTRCVGCGISKYKPRSLLLTNIVVRPLARISGCCGVILSGEVRCVFSTAALGQNAMRLQLDYLC